jgi:hypothetical protein
VGGWARDGLFQRNGKSWHLRTVLFKIKLKCSSALFEEIPLIEPCSSPLCVINFVVLFPFPYPSPGARISMLVISARRDADKALCSKQNVLMFCRPPDHRPDLLAIKSPSGPRPS